MLWCLLVQLVYPMEQTLKVLKQSVELVGGQARGNITVELRVVE
ncbi:hypothetical protein [Brevibacillus dissolubilis]|nr:hypothetical protein [Brevibacillus dissolubilis]